MYLPPIGMTGKAARERTRPAVFETPSSGLWRLAAAFAVILALALTADLMLPGDVQPAAVTTATGG